LDSGTPAPLVGGAGTRTFFKEPALSASMNAEAITQAMTYRPTFGGAGERVYNDGYLRVEHDNFYVSCGGKYVKLFHKEFFILSRLAQARGQVVPQQTLWEYAWGTDAPFNALTLRSHVYHLRQKLEPYGIQVDGVVNIGYRLHSDAQTEGRIARQRKKA
jgi:DNA-binding response OmpR family regulator